MEEEYYIGKIRVIRTLDHKDKNPSILAGDDINISSSDIDKCVKLMIERKMNQMSFVSDYLLDNIDFIKNYDLSFVKGIYITRPIKDLSPVYNLKNLTHL